MTIVLDNDLEHNYDRFLSRGKRVVEECQSIIDDTSVGSIDSEAIIGFYRRLTQAKIWLSSFVLIPGIVQFIKDSENNQSYDVSVEITTLTSRIDSALLWIETNFPKTSGWLLFLRIVDGVIEPRGFSSAATAGLRTELQAIIDWFIERST